MKTTTNLVKALTIVVISTVSIFYSCKKETNPTGQMTVKMTDAPAAYTSVNVEVIGCEVHHEQNGWISLPVNQGVYDLLTLQNDVSVVLANNVALPIGKINQMRLILGTHNTIIDATGTYTLEVPSGAETGLKLNVNQQILPNHTVVILLDFDANASIVVNGTGKYTLTPVLKIKSVTQI